MPKDLRRLQLLRLLQVLVVALCCLPIFAQAFKVVEPAYGQENIRVAQDLLATGVLTNGAGEVLARPGRALAPGYPVLLALVSAALPETTSMSQAMRLLNTALALACLAIAYRLFFALSGMVSVSWLAVLFFGTSAHLTEFINFATGHLLVIALMLTSLLFAVDGLRRHSNVLAASAGLFAGLAALVDPYQLVAACLMVPALALAHWLSAHTGGGHSGGEMSAAGRRAVVLQPALFAAAAALTILPWIVRNALTFGDVALVDQHIVSRLALRAAYNEMTTGQWFGALLFWTPAIGPDLLGRAHEQMIASLDPQQPGTLMNDAYLRIYAGAIASAQPYAFVIGKTIVSDPIAHLMASVALAWRGIGGGTRWLGLVGALLLLPFLRLQRRTGNLPAFLVAAVPIVGMCLVQSLIIPNEWWNNIMMPAILSYVVAYLLATL